MSYQIIPPMYEGGPTTHVLRLRDMAAIPTFDPDSTSYKEYQAWLAEGNEPLPADEPPAE